MTKMYILAPHYKIINTFPALAILWIIPTLLTQIYSNIYFISFSLLLHFHIAWPAIPPKKCVQRFAILWQCCNLPITDDLEWQSCVPRKPVPFCLRSMYRFLRFKGSAEVTGEIIMFHLFSLFQLSNRWRPGILLDVPRLVILCMLHVSTSMFKGLGGVNPVWTSQSQLRRSVWSSLSQLVS